jgi:hypothetical protein
VLGAHDVYGGNADASLRGAVQIPLLDRWRGTVAAQPLFVFGVAGGIVLLKLLVIVLLARAFGLNWANSQRTGMLLGPGGEFAFVIVSVAIGEHLLAPETARVLLFVTALTMATIPLLSRLGDRLAPHLAPKTPLDPHLLVPEVSDPLSRARTDRRRRRAGFRAGARCGWRARPFQVLPACRYG